ncbi:citrate lyase subunit alpha [Acidaminobacter sp. JC074]|uniref:citrate lyase subunit alpha n=1 Tax=Acidaminobacter sp. JC074 TaxID=2530199 RepID=UPI001F103315|nr:citrate lyase subunit alpha [Acidaminobacter sp. JC074]MCH4890683.1 citrate lyase subunit alpha [Acidaminobacter sp. JC074]
MHRLFEHEFSFRPSKHKKATSIKMIRPGEGKLRKSLKDAIEASGLRDGMTLSFHHHFRSGDYVLMDVMKILDEMNFKDLKIAASSLTSAHDGLVEYIKNGLVTGIHTSGLRGVLARTISGGLLNEPVVIRSHGGRARAIEAGDIHIDIAFLGVPSSDDYGNANGQVGQAICGSLGYAKMDAEYADHVILITDTLVDYPNTPASINQMNVDQVVVVDRIGDSSKIASGATRFTKNPKELLIAKRASEVIINSDYFKEGFSFQTGSGGSSLAVTRFLEEAMKSRKITASFALGGITQPMVSLHEKGLIKQLYDVQSFDLSAAESIKKSPLHHEISASLYANPHTMGCMVNRLDVVILSALEIDKHFNVNVMTGSDGVIMGASGGHCDTAAAASLTIIVAPLTRGRIPTVVEKVDTIITPGESVDVLVTDRGIAVNPRRQDLVECFNKSHLPIKPIEGLVAEAEAIVGPKQEIQHNKQTVAIVEYRDGSVIDEIKGIS